jgi:hypothetical protein
MDFQLLVQQFRAIGADLDIRLVEGNNWRGVPPDFSLDVQEMKRKETFVLSVLRAAVEKERFRLFTVDLQPKNRHLLLHGDTSNEGARKLLCGHDERHWFVAAAGSANAVNVREAMESLKPETAIQSQIRQGVRQKDWHRRHNPGFVRQGEWFFVPRPEIMGKDILSLSVLRHEPLQRGRGRPHWVDFLYRHGGETVYVSSKFPNGLTEQEYKAHLDQHPNDRRHLTWRVMRRNPKVLVKGRVRHPDHATIELPFWHEVLLSQESLMTFVAFLD